MKPDRQPLWGLVDWPSLLDAARSDLDGAICEVFQRLSNYCSMVAGSRLPVDLASKVGASDIAQKSLLEAFSQFSAFEGRSESEIRAWLTQIVQHNVIDATRYFRESQRRTLSQEQRLDANFSSTQFPSSFPSPSHALRREEQDGALQRAIEQLTEQQRRVIELRYRDGLDYRQIATAMDLSEAAARKVSSRAVEALRKLLAIDDAARQRD